MGKVTGSTYKSSLHMDSEKMKITKERKRDYIL
jgi:hypothetical protein